MTSSKWNHFPRYWPFARGIYRSPVNSPHKGQWCGALMSSLICAWTDALRLGKPSRRPWLETLSRSLWRQCNKSTVWMLQCQWSICEDYWWTGSYKTNNKQSRDQNKTKPCRYWWDILWVCLSIPWGRTIWQPSLKFTRIWYVQRECKDLYEESRWQGFAILINRATKNFLLPWTPFPCMA